MTRLALLVLLFASQSYAQNISGLVPDSIEGRLKSDSARIYAGDDLYRLIDGGADIFKEYGFDTVVVQRYSDMRDDYVDVELYQMKDSSAAYGIFSAVTFTTGRRIDDFPCEAYAGDGFLLFWKGEYYGSLTASQPSGYSGLVRAAEVMASRIAGLGKPQLAAMFTRSGFSYRDELKIAYIKGGLGLYNLSTIPFGEHFRFVDGVCLSAAGVKSFVFTFKTREACSTSYSLITEELKNSGDWDTLYTRRDDGLFRNGNSFLRTFHTGCYIVVSTSEVEAGLERVTDEIRQVLAAKDDGSE